MKSKEDSNHRTLESNTLNEESESASMITEQVQQSNFGLKEFPPNSYNKYAWLIGEPKIADDVWIGAFTLIDGSGGLSIGKGVNISSGAQLVSHSSARRTVTARAYPKVDRASVKIGAHTFIGSNAVILMGSTIGKHCVVAAGAVVKEFSVFPDYSLIAGVPAVRRGDVRWKDEIES